MSILLWSPYLVFELLLDELDGLDDVLELFLYINRLGYTLLHVLRPSQRIWHLNTLKSHRD